MSTHLIKLFTQPDHSWTEIRKEEEQKPRNYLPHLIFLGLIPPFALFIGTTRVGWSLAENETVRLSADSALLLSAVVYGAILLGTALMGGFIRWMSRSFDARPSLNQCIGFAAYTATPLYLAGLAALYPSRWLAVVVLMAACAYSTFLLFVGLPTFMRRPQEQGFLFASCVWAVGLLLMVTTLVTAILLWYNGLSPEYLRGPLGQ
ncbi:hypothetical protein ACVW0Y_000235 [Pseudomonas sp. TE3786]